MALTGWECLIEEPSSLFRSCYSDSAASAARISSAKVINAAGRLRQKRHHWICARSIGVILETLWPALPIPVASHVSCQCCCCFVIDVIASWWGLVRPNCLNAVVVHMRAGDLVVEPAFARRTSRSVTRTKLRAPRGRKRPLLPTLIGRTRPRRIL